MLFFGEKLTFWALSLNKQKYVAKIGRCSRFVGCDDDKKHQLVPFTHYHDVVILAKQEAFSSNKKQIIKARTVFSTHICVHGPQSVKPVPK